MSGTTSIEWTERTWNPCVGCSIVSPGCHNCYAATMAKRLRAMAISDIAKGLDPGRKRHYIDVVDDAGRWTGKVVAVPEALGDPLKWRKPQTVFVNSMSDLFHESLPFEFIDQVFAVMNATHLTLPISQQSKDWHTYQVLTKRADRLVEYIRSRSPSLFKQGQHPVFEAGRGEGGSLRGQHDGGYIMNAGAVLLWPLPNVILGVSVEDQKREARFASVCELGEAGWRTMVSIEPLLSPVTIPDRYLSLGDKAWVIVGGESGHGSRECDTRSIHSIVERCRIAGVACFVKQLGARPTGMTSEALANIRSPKGGNIDEWPAPLRVRDMPVH